MPVITCRPDGVLSPGIWTIVGPPGITMDQALNDDSDLTWVEIAGPAQTDEEIAKLSIQDFDVPDGAKIFAVRSRIRVQKIQATPENPDPPTPQPHCGFHRRGFIALLILFIFRILFGFRCPRKPPPKDPDDPPTPTEWATVEQAYYPEQPGGGEWTEQTFDDFFVSLGRSDSEAVTLRISEVLVDLDYNEAPSVAVTGPVGPLVDITLGTVTWDYSDPEHDKQGMFWVRIFDEETYSSPAFDPATSTAFDETVDGWTKGEDNFWTLNRDTPNGNYRAFVKTRQVWGGIGEHESEWAYWQWTQDVPGPPDPELTATYEADLNRVRVDLHEGGPSPATDTYNIEYSDNLGITWDLVRSGERVDIDDERDSIVYDYEAPLNRVRWYRGAAFRVLNSILVTSGFSNVASVTPLSDRFALKDPLVPSLNMKRLWITDMTRTKPRPRGIFKPLVSDENQQARAIAITGPQFGDEGEIVVAYMRNINDEEEHWEEFEAINRSGRTLLLQAPNNEQWYVSLGDLKYGKWIIRNNKTKLRHITIPYIEVDPPPDLTVTKKR